MNKAISLAVVLFIGLGLVGLFILALPTSAAIQISPEASIVVDTLEDELNSDDDCSLREAIQAANDNIPVDACPAGEAITDTINFSISGTIILTEQLTVIAGGPLVIDGGEVITVSGNDSVRIFNVADSANLKLNSLWIKDGNLIDENGGGIYNSGFLSVIDCILSNNWATSEISLGGGIYNDGIVNITNSILTNNFGSIGGAIYNDETGIAYIKDSELSNNHTVLGVGGGIYNLGTLILNQSIVENNESNMSAGGIYNVGNLTMSNSTISGNWVFQVDEETDGGGISNGGELSITNSTITDNHADNGGGIHTSLGTVMLYNTILAKNMTGGNCTGDITDGGNNIDSEDTCGFDPANGSMPNTDPLLGPLQDNGGPTWTRALLPNSPAIDAADQANCPTTDQRGVQRPFDGNGDGLATCDIGSYELADEIVMDPAFVLSSAAPGATVSYNIDLYNFTDLTDTYTLTMGTFIWETTLSPELIGPIQRGKSQPFTVSVSIPITASWYMTDTVSVFAASVTSPTLYSTNAQITTQALPPPQISISPPALIGTQHIDDIVTLPLTISNGFGVTLTFSIMPLKVVPWLNYEPLSGTVNTNSSTQVPVTLDATGLLPDVYTNTLIINSNDPDSPNIRIPVTMTVKSQPIIYLPVISRFYCPDFYDGFSNPASGWYVGDDEFVRSEYLNGEYRILTKQSGYVYLYSAPTCALDSYVVEVDARWVGTPGASYGLIFGLLEDFDHFYLLEVNTDYREFRVLRADPDGWHGVVPITYSSAVNSGNAYNHLKIIRSGNQITLEVNGYVLGSWNDSTITGFSYVGIASAPYNDYPTSDARFDNFSLLGLPSGFGIFQDENGSIVPIHCSDKPNGGRITPQAVDDGWKNIGFEKY